MFWAYKSTEIKKKTTELYKSAKLIDLQNYINLQNYIDLQNYINLQNYISKNIKMYDLQFPELKEPKES